MEGIKYRIAKMAYIDTICLTWLTYILGTHNMDKLTQWAGFAPPSH